MNKIVGNSSVMRTPIAALRVIATIIAFSLALTAVSLSPIPALAFVFPNNFSFDNQDAGVNNQFTNLIRQCISANLMTGAFISNNPVVFCNQLIQSELNQAPIFFQQCLAARLGFSNNPFGLCRQQLQIFIDQLLTQNNNNINNNLSNLQILTNIGLTSFLPQSNGMIQLQFPPPLLQPNTMITPFIPQPPPPPLP